LAVKFGAYFVPLAVEFSTFAVEFVGFAVEFVVLAPSFVPLAMEIEAFAIIELGTFGYSKIDSWDKHGNKM